MNKIFVSLIFSLLLTGCDSLPILTDSDSSEEKTIREEINNSDDQYYLKIAKDLYAAEQYQQAMKIAKNLAEKGNSEAQYLLGYLIYYGQGVTADKNEGSKWIKISADAGYRPAIEALVMIKYGLTPNNKCVSPVDISEDVEKVKREQAGNNNQRQQPEKVTQEIQSQVQQQTETKTLKSISLTQQLLPEKEIEIDSTHSDRQWKRYTIQLMQTSNLEYLIDFYNAFKQQYPEWGDHLITYQSKRQPYAYGIGLNTYDSTDDAKETLNKLKKQFNDNSLWLKPLNKSMPYTLN